MSIKENKKLTAILYILIGVLLCVFRAGLLGWAMTAIGVLLIVSAVLSFISLNVIGGVISAVLAVLVIVGGWLFIDILLLIVGIVMLINGVREILALKGKKTALDYVRAALPIVFGLLLIFSKWAMMDWMFIIIGVLILVDGVLMLMGKK